jgi:hypothetical protein
MKRILATLTLTCVLAVPALAGEIPTCNPSPTAVATGTGPETGTGDVSTASSATDPSETDSGVLTVLLLTLVTIVVR